MSESAFLQYNRLYNLKPYWDYKPGVNPEVNEILPLLIGLVGREVH